MTINNLKHLLAQKGKKSKDLAAQLGVGPTQVSQWAAGRPCSDANAHRIAAFLGVRVEELCGAPSVSVGQSHATRELQLEREKLALERRVMELEMQIERSNLERDRLYVDRAKAELALGAPPKSENQPAPAATPFVVHAGGGKPHAAMPGYEARPESEAGAAEIERAAASTSDTAAFLALFPALGAHVRSARSVEEIPEIARAFGLQPSRVLLAHLTNAIKRKGA